MQLFIISLPKYNKLIWKISDFSDGSVKLFQNGSVIHDSPYKFGELFEWYFSSTYKFGDYNFTLEATDNSENSATSTIEVVIDPSSNSTSSSVSSSITSTTSSTTTDIITTPSSSSTSSQNEKSQTDSVDSPTSPLNGFILPTSIFVLIVISQFRKKKT
jgi:hypothetical protein